MAASRISKSASIVDLQPLHLLQLRQSAQDAQRGEVAVQGVEMPGGRAWAAVHDGRAVAAAGVIELWPGRAYAWALFAEWWPVRAVILEMRAKLDELLFARLEMAVDTEFEPAARFAERLGFVRESTARRYLPNGHDAHIYVRLR